MGYICAFRPTNSLTRLLSQRRVIDVVRPGLVAVLKWYSGGTWMKSPKKAVEKKKSIGRTKRGAGEFGW